MPIINLDMSKTENNNLIPEGEYQAFVYDVAQRQNKAGDGFYLNWQFKIQGGDSEGKLVFHITSLKDNALFKLRELLEAIGYSVPTDGQLELDTDDLMGKKCTLVIGHREYQGKQQNEIREILTAKASEQDEFDNEY